MTGEIYNENYKTMDASSTTDRYGSSSSGTDSPLLFAACKHAHKHTWVYTGINRLRGASIKSRVLICATTLLHAHGPISLLHCPHTCAGSPPRHCVSSCKKEILRLRRHTPAGRHGRHSGALLLYTCKSSLQKRVCTRAWCREKQEKNAMLSRRTRWRLSLSNELAA